MNVLYNNTIMMMILYSIQFSRPEIIVVFPRNMLMSGQYYCATT